MLHCVYKGILQRSVVLLPVSGHKMGAVMLHSTLGKGYQVSHGSYVPEQTDN